MESNWEGEMDDGMSVVLIVVFAVLVFVGGCFIGKDFYHDQYCHEQYAHAPTPADSLLVAQSDGHCADLLTP